MHGKPHHGFPMARSRNSPNSHSAAHMGGGGKRANGSQRNHIYAPAPEVSETVHYGVVRVLLPTTGILIANGRSVPFLRTAVQGQLPLIGTPVSFQLAYKPETAEQLIPQGCAVNITCIKRIPVPNTSNRLQKVLRTIDKRTKPMTPASVKPQQDSRTSKHNNKDPTTCEADVAWPPLSGPSGAPTVDTNPTQDLHHCTQRVVIPVEQRITCSLPVVPTKVDLYKKDLLYSDEDRLVDTLIHNIDKCVDLPSGLHPFHPWRWNYQPDILTEEDHLCLAWTPQLDEDTQQGEKVVSEYLDCDDALDHFIHMFDTMTDSGSMPSAGGASASGGGGSSADTSDGVALDTLLPYSSHELEMADTMCSILPIVLQATPSYHFDDQFSQFCEECSLLQDGDIPTDEELIMEDESTFPFPSFSGTADSPSSPPSAPSSKSKVGAPPPLSLETVQPNPNSCYPFMSLSSGNEDVVSPQTLQRGEGGLHHHRVTATTLPTDTTAAGGVLSPNILYGELTLSPNAFINCNVFGQLHTDSPNGSENAPSQEEHDCGTELGTQQQQEEDVKSDSACTCGADKQLKCHCTSSSSSTSSTDSCSTTEPTTSSTTENTTDDTTDDDDPQNNNTTAQRERSSSSGSNTHQQAGKMSGVPVSVVPRSNLALNPLAQPFTPTTTNVHAKREGKKERSKEQRTAHHNHSHKGKEHSTATVISGSGVTRTATPTESALWKLLTGGASNGKMIKPHKGHSKGHHKGHGHGSRHNGKVGALPMAMMPSFNHAITTAEQQPAHPMNMNIPFLNYYFPPHMNVRNSWVPFGE